MLCQPYFGSLGQRYRLFLDLQNARYLIFRPHNVDNLTKKPYIVTLNGYNTIMIEESENKIEEAVTVEKPRKMPFPTWIDLLATLGIFFLVQFFTGVVAIALGWQLSMPEGVAELSNELQRMAEIDLGHSVFLCAMVSQPLILLLVLLYRSIRRGRWVGIKISVNGFNPSVLLWGVLLIISSVVVIEPLMDMLPAMKVPEGRGVYMILALLVVAPIFEELLCRGVILEAVRSRYSAWVGCVVSAVIFAVMHVEPQAVLNAFVLGLLLGYVYLRTNSIFAPIILHSINNVFAYMFLIFGVSHLSLSEMIGGGTIYTMVYCGSVAVMILAAISIARRMKRIEREDQERKLASVK